MSGRKKDIRDYSKLHERLLIKRAVSKIMSIRQKNRQVAVKYDALLEHSGNTVYKDVCRSTGLLTSELKNNDIDKEIDKENDRKNDREQNIL